MFWHIQEYLGNKTIGEYLTEIYPCSVDQSSCHLLHMLYILMLLGYRHRLCLELMSLTLAHCLTFKDIYPAKTATGDFVGLSYKSVRVITPKSETQLVF